MTGQAKMIFNYW